MNRNLSLENIEYFKKTTLENINQGLQNIQIYNQRKEVLKKDLLILGDVKKLLIQLKNSKMFEKKDFILNTINTALSDVFIDQNVKIDLVASNTNQEASKLNIKYDIVLYQNGVELSRNEKMVDQNGGGIISFISILFKILVGFIYSRNRFYVFDESLSEVSELYLPRIGQFLQKFCKVHNFTIILITHTPVVAEYSDLTYRLDGEFENGVPTLKIDKIEGEYPEENFIYSKIENFQSIKKLEFRYKGFTTIIGKNNIGKSASFRAINSILFNNFDIKIHPRFESVDKPDKLLNTKIEFGFFSKKDDPENEIKKIGFYKKGQSIIWYFNNMEFVGKNLAFDKVKEKVESIGFKYLKLKEQYKNFKGNLKDQTERLAITTQQDGYYLIAGKASDTSKVFDFLFDSREVTLALIKLNEDIKNFENELNSLEQQTGELEFINSRLRLELKKWDLQYKISLIELLKETISIKEFNKSEFETYSKEFILYNKILELVDLIWRIEKTKELNSIVVSKKEKIEKVIKVLDNLINKLNYKDLIDSTLLKSRTINILKIKKLMVEKQYNIINIKEIIDTNNFVNNIRSKFNFFRTKYIVLGNIITNFQNRGILEEIFITLENIEIKKKRFEKLQLKFSIITNIMEKIKFQTNLKNNLIEINNCIQYKNKIEHSINYNNKCLEFYDKNIKLYNLKDFILNINDIDKKNQSRKKQIQDLYNTIENLPRAYGLKPCSVCETLGFTPEGHSH